jgi:hypothetical protein
MSSWVEKAEEALAGARAEGVEVVNATRPPLLDALGMQALTSPFLAALMWAAAVFRETVSGHPWDWMALLCRCVALALSARAALFGWRFYKRLRVWASHSRYRLALADDGLILRTPAGDTAVAREHVAGVVEQGEWGSRSGRRWSDVYLVTSPHSGRLYTAVPPLFAKTPGVLAEKLMRWMGVREGSAPPAAGESRGAPELASKLYDRVAAGERPPGVSVVLQGRAWLRSGPYATVLLGAALLDGLVRLMLRGRVTVSPIAVIIIAVALLLVPLAWLLLVQQHVEPRKGIALLMTPAEMLMRMREGVIRVRWSSLEGLQIVTKTAWSVLEGPYRSRTLIIRRKNDPPINYLESFLGVPAEVVVCLAEAYRKGVLR